MSFITYSLKWLLRGLTFENIMMSVIHVRRTVTADLEFVLTAERHPDNAPYVGQWHQERHARAIASADEAHFIIELSPTEPASPITGQVTGQVTGQITGKPTVQQSRGHAIGYMICQGLQNEHDAVSLCRIVITEKGKGYGRQALEWLKAYAFNTLGTHRLWFDVIASNQRARSLYASAGFKEEGILRGAWKTTAGYKPLIILSMLDDEYSAGQ